jgi:hypothetical protein
MISPRMLQSPGFEADCSYTLNFAKNVRQFPVALFPLNNAENFVGAVSIHAKKMRTDCPESSETCT